MAVPFRTVIVEGAKPKSRIETARLGTPAEMPDPGPIPSTFAAILKASPLVEVSLGRKYSPSVRIPRSAPALTYPARSQRDSGTSEKPAKRDDGEIFFADRNIFVISALVTASVGRKASAS